MPAYAQTVIHSDTAKKQLLGTHSFSNFSLGLFHHYPFGKAVFEEKAGTIYLNASQESERGFTHIKGVVTEVGKKYFKLRGEINMFDPKVSDDTHLIKYPKGYIYNGKNNCLGNGLYTFKVPYVAYSMPDKEKYWQLEQKTNFCQKPGGSSELPQYKNFSYYINIFFGPPRKR